MERDGKNQLPAMDMNTNLLKSERPKPMFLSVSSAILIFSLVAISILMVTDTLSKVNYTFAQTSILRTTDLKVDFKKLVELGSNQNVRVSLRDIGTGDPISSATIRFTIYFPGGTPIRQLMLLTDTNGRASLTLPIAKNAAVGQYGLDVVASALGYFDTAVGTVNFDVMSQVDHNDSLSDYKHTIPTLSDTAGNHKHHDDNYYVVTCDPSTNKCDTVGGGGRNPAG
jgi:hypothetical protein